jgi:uncharacterized membrane protein HdeD (DUF308 family)
LGTTKESKMDILLLNSLGRFWWLVLFRGFAAIAFGAAAMAWPGVTLTALTLLWGAYALVDGVTAVWLGWQTKGNGGPLWQVVLIGVIGIAAGLLTFVFPGITALALLMIIAAWAIVTGVFQMLAAIRLRREIANEWLLALSGILSVVFGGLMFANPGAGALALLWVIAAFAISYGVLLVVLSFRMKGLATPISRVPV